MTRHNPQILEYEVENAFDPTDEYVPSEDDSFMVAIGFVHFLTGEPLNDPRYVKWVNSYAEYIGGVYTPR